MAGFKVEKQTAGAIVLDDLGITLVGAIGTIVDLTYLAPEEIARSADLLAAIPATVLVVDPRDDTDATIFSSADSTDAISRHNDSHLGVSGGRFGALDDPTVTPSNEFLVQYDSGSDAYISVSVPSILEGNQDTIGAVIGTMGVDGTDSTFVYNATNTFLSAGQDETLYDNVGNNGTFTGGDGVGVDAHAVSDQITLSDGSVILVDAIDVNDDVTDFTVLSSGLSNVTPGVTLTFVSSTGSGTVFDLTPQDNNIGNGSIQWDVNDSFLRNTGDTLDSGTLTIASGATVSFASGSNLTIDAAVTTATIGTPGGGFTGDTDIINKLYVDNVINGLDWKDSVRACTDTGEDLTGAPYNGTYSAVGGTGGTGEFTGVDLTNAVDGITLALDDRLLVKSQGTGTQNGLYVVTTAGAAGVLERTADHDSNADVTANNAVFVEEGTTCADTAWVITTDDPITLNTTAITWAQFAGPGAITAGIGLSRAGTVIDLDVNDLTTATVVAGDIIAFHDLDGVAESSGSQTRKTTFTSIFNELDVPNAITVNGLITRTAADTYASRSIAVNGAGALDGLVVSNADGSAGNPTLGLDIQNLPATGAVDAALDRVAVWDSSANANVYYTVTQIATATSANSFETWLAAGNSSGDVSIVADSATDTATLTGGDAINIDFTALTDTIVFDLDISLLGAGTTVALADVIAVDQGADPNVKFTFTDVVQDLDIPNAITTNGIVVRTAADTYASRTITASVDEDELGATITNGDGVAGNPTVGIDIDGTTASPADMAATDEFLTHDKSEGTAGANRSMTGQQIADGVETILGLPVGLAIATINGQPIVVYSDTTRTKTLSVESAQSMFANNALADSEWMDIGDASNTDAGIVMPLDGTVVMATGHTEDANSNTFGMDLYIDAVDSGSIGSLSGAGESSFTSTTLDLDFSQGQKLRVRGDRSAGTGSLGDVNVIIHVRWRS